ncbi:MAG: hypothetical protein V1788_03145 [Nanoarchaeota archaeon]
MKTLKTILITTLALLPLIACNGKIEEPKNKPEYFNQLEILLPRLGGQYITMDDTNKDGYIDVLNAGSREHLGGIPLYISEEYNDPSNPPVKGITRKMSRKTQQIATYAIGALKDLNQSLDIDDKEAQR